MSTAFVLMTALPPTKGHLQLMRFAVGVRENACVIIATQPDEPYVDERVAAITDAASESPGMRVVHIHRALPQRPEGVPDFWEMWRGFLVDAGCVGEGDAIVASEAYGARLAEVTGARFIPFDIAREVTPIKATRVREDPFGRFAEIMPSFQPAIRRRITIHGAESTGKTTLSRALAVRLGGHWLPEWARPYLEFQDDPAVDDQRMEDIRIGQRALQAQGRRLVDKPVIVQDTDLFATVGYWQLWNPERMPKGLVDDALADRSDLYLVTRSNIPFRPDPLRYGGDKRESSDEYWIALAERHGLDVEVLDSADPAERLDEAEQRIREHWRRTVRLDYVRRDND